MASSSTTFLKMNRWNQTDDFRLAEVNDNFKKIDDHLKTLGELVVFIEFFPRIIPEVDDTGRIQRAVDFILANGGRGTLKFAAKDYYAQQIVMRTAIEFEGSGIGATKIYASNSNKPALFVIAEGPVVRAAIRNMTIDGNGYLNSGQIGILAEAKTNAQNTTGGLWWSSLQNIRIENFEGDNIYLKGGASGSNRPIQFIKMDYIISMRDNRSPTSKSRAIRMTGQVGQITVVGGEYDGSIYQQRYGTNIEISKEYDSNGNALGGNSAYAVDFMNITSQCADLIAIIDNAVCISFRTCYFEKANRTARVVNTAWNIGFDNCQFLNSCSDGLGGGYGVSVESYSYATIRNNYFGGDAVDMSFKGDPLHKGIDHGGNYGTVITSGVTFRISPTSGTVNIAGHDSIVMDGNSSIDPISTIQSVLGPGQSIKLRALSTLNLSTSGNLVLGGKATLRLETDEVATFTRDDFSNKLVLSGTSKTSEQSVVTAGNSDSLINVRGRTQVNLNHASATEVTGFSNGYEGQTIYVIAFTEFTTLRHNSLSAQTSSSHLFLKGQSDLPVPKNATLLFRYTAGKWYQF